MVLEQEHRGNSEFISVSGLEDGYSIHERNEVDVGVEDQNLSNDKKSSDGEKPTNEK